MPGNWPGRIPERGRAPFIPGPTANFAGDERKTPMISVDMLGSPVWLSPTFNNINNTFSSRHGMAGSIDSYELSRSIQTPTPETCEIPKHQQWPWRSFAFFSDLGTEGYLVNKPQLAGIGWLIALSYYIYAIFSQPKGKKRNEEVVYQATANGIMPFAEAKAAVLAGEYIQKKLAVPFQKRNKVSLFKWVSLPASKVTGGLMALLALTPGVGDPVSKRIIKVYQSYVKEEAKP